MLIRCDDAEASLTTQVNGVYFIEFIVTSATNYLEVLLGCKFVKSLFVQAVYIHGINYRRNIVWNIKPE
ncbi:hypothetical protein D3C86_1732630 [compost metagenome]